MNILNVPFCSYDGKPNFPQVFEKNGGDDETRTRDLCRDSAAGNGFTTTYKHAGTAKRRASRTRLQELWVGLWVQILTLNALLNRNPSDSQILTRSLRSLGDAVSPLPSRLPIPIFLHDSEPRARRSLRGFAGCWWACRPGCAHCCSRELLFSSGRSAICKRRTRDFPGIT